MESQIRKNQADPLPLKVLHVTEAPLGGVVAYLEEVLKYQTQQNFASVEVISPEINEEMLRVTNDPNFFIETYQHNRASLFAPIRLAYLTIRRTWRTRPHILHVHSTIAGAIVRATRPFLPRKTKIVYCAHGWAFSRVGSSKKNSIIAFLERLLSRLCDRIICISQYELHEAKRAGIPSSSCLVIENGIDPRFPPTPKADRPTSAQLDEESPMGKKTIVFVGRFDQQKGYDTFLDVLRLLGDEARGVAIGKAIVSSEDNLFDLPENLTVLGWQTRDKVFEAYLEADLLLVPSRWEGFGLVAIEAMQASLAVFASRVGGLQDIVIEGETGQLFEPDRPEEIADAIKKISLNTLRRQGENGYKRYQARYTGARMNKSIMELYMQLANSD